MVCFLQLKDLGKIVDIILQPSESGELEVLLEFENADQVRSAVSNGPKELQGSLIEIFRCRPNQKIWNFQAKQEDEKIYISNLSPNIEKKTLREIFGIVFLSIINHSMEKSKKFVL